jgi:LuxR family maltose regulon positive regulatory protein
MATTELPFDLIEAKLALSARRADTVVKTELVERLRRSSGRVASVVAPAGFGKTTLCAHLAQRDERAFAIVSLDERDNDPVVLLRYVAVALDRVEPVPPSVFEALSTPGQSVWSTCIPRVCAALSAMATPVVLVLDDLHLVQDLTSLDAVTALVDHVPERSLIVVASREVPELPLPCLRVQGRALEVGVDDLRLNIDEAAALLHNAGVTIDASAVSELADRTEGWPAGLYLAALSPGGRLGRGRRAYVRRRRPFRGRISAVRAAVAADGRGGALSHAHVGAGADVRRPLRRGPGR